MERSQAELLVQTSRIMEAIFFITRPEKIREFEKIAKIMEKSGNLKIPSGIGIEAHEMEVSDVAITYKA